jgi:hypothetical protein
VPAFIVAQIAGAGAATVLFRWLNQTDSSEMRSEHERTETRVVSLHR